MRKSIVQALLITTGLVVGSSAFAGANCQAHPKAEQIPQATFEASLKKYGFNVKKFEVSGNCYELYGKSPKGKKVEIYFDTKNGSIVKKEIDD